MYFISNVKLESSSCKGQLPPKRWHQTIKKTLRHFQEDNNLYGPPIQQMKHGSLGPDPRQSFGRARGRELQHTRPFGPRLTYEMEFVNPH